MRKNPLHIGSLDRLAMVAVPIALLWLGVAMAF